MIKLQHIGFYSIKIAQSFRLFFHFFGHLSHCSLNIILRKATVSRFYMAKVIYHSGAKIVIPLMIISGLLAISLSINTSLLLSRFNMEHQALPIAVNILTLDLLPLLIGFVLCVQSALNLINARIKIKKLRQTPEDVILAYILPIILGINITGLLLYLYMLASIFLSVYFAFHFSLNLNTKDYLLHMTKPIVLVDLFYSISKTLLYCNIIAITAGYYYYEVAIREVTLRKAISRILTRGSLWLTVSSVYVKFLHF